MNSGTRFGVGWGVMDRQLNNKERWLSFCTIFFFGLMAIFSMFRVSPVLLEIGDAFGMTMANVGLINSVFAIMGVILAFPGTWLMRRFGIKRSLFVAGAITFIGAIIGIVATDQGLFLFSRVLEGSGLGLISILGPAICPRLFPPKKQGITMGIWSLWLPAGVVISFFLAPTMSAAFGWKSLWALSIVFDLISLVWITACFKLPKVAENVLHAEAITEKGKKANYGKPNMLSAVLIAAAFTVWCIVFDGGVNGFYPTYLQQIKGLDVFTAALVSSMIALFTLPLGIFMGWLSDRVKTRKWFVVIAYAALTVMMATVAWTENNSMAPVWIFIIITSFISAAIPMGTRAAIPEYAKEPKKVDYALASMTFFQNIGLFLAGFVGTAVAYFDSWTDQGLFVLAPISLIAVIMTIVCRNDRKQMLENERAHKMAEERMATRESEE